MYHILLSLALVTQPSVAGPKADDVTTLDGILAAVYDTISGPAGEKRDWDRFRSLFHPDARLIPVTAQKDGARATVMSVEDYIKRSGPYLEGHGFFEKGVAQRVERFAHIAHVWSTYEGRTRAEDEKPFVTGINSFQLIWDGKRWWVLHIAWSPATSEHPLPERYLPGGR